MNEPRTSSNYEKNKGQEPGKIICGRSNTCLHTVSMMSHYIEASAR